MNDDRKEKVEVDPDMIDAEGIDVSFHVEMDSYIFDKVLNHFSELERREQYEVMLHLGKMLVKDIQKLEH